MSDWLTLGEGENFLLVVVFLKTREVIRARMILSVLPTLFMRLREANLLVILLGVYSVVTASPGIPLHSRI